MPALSAPFIEMLTLAATGMTEGQKALTEAHAVGAEAARPLLAYGNQAVAGAFTQIKATARRYMGATEYLNPRAPRLLLSDAAFRAAVAECAGAVEVAAPVVSVAARRIPAVMRRWLDNPAEAALLATQADTAVRLAKTRAGRAA